MANYLVLIYENEAQWAAAEPSRFAVEVVDENEYFRHGFVLLR